MSRKAQELFQGIASSRKPYVAAIQGACLGGGLELALACHYRIASPDPKTVFALPEVMLGLLPGAGGTQRLPRLIGIQAALDMMLTGKNIRAPKAMTMGLVDRLVNPPELRQAAVDAAKQLARGELKRRARRRGWKEVLLEGTALSRALLFHFARKQVLKKTGGLYPAPPAILDVVRNGCGRPLAQGLAYEAARFGELTQTAEAKSLIGIFFGQTALKKNRFGRPAHAAERIGILGAGFMGAGIALVSAQKGFIVQLKDVKEEPVLRAIQQISSVLDERVARQKLSRAERNAVLARVHGQTDYSDFSSCGLVIEAVFEDLAIKQKVLQEIEAQTPEGCVIASNTSALPIAQIARACLRPHTVLGMHYFSPVHKMPLLEVIVTPQTSPEAKAVAVDAGLRQGKTVIVVNDGPGFYTSRILAPFMDEAILLLVEGIDPYRLDALIRKWGYPVGPITLLDEVGIDVASHVARFLKGAIGERVSTADPQLMEAITGQGFLGRKVQKGFFLYPKGARGRKPLNEAALSLLQSYRASNGVPAATDAEIQERLALRMVNEAIFCLQEKILENPIDGDIGAVFGLGFPPSRGGPFRYVDSVGPQQVVGHLNRLAEKFGRRFVPAPALVDLAGDGKRFYRE